MDAEEQNAPPATPATLTASQLASAMKATLLTQAIEANPVAKLGVGQLVQLWESDFKIGMDP